MIKQITVAIDACIRGIVACHTAAAEGAVCVCTGLGATPVVCGTFINIWKIYLMNMKRKISYAIFDGQKLDYRLDKYA